MAFATLLVLANVLFERSAIGVQFERWGDAMLQASLRPTDMPRVVVLNIAGIGVSNSAVAARYGDSPAITSRKDLRALVEAIADLGPSAIGIDVDMSPRNGLYVDPDEDPDFFARLRALRDSKHVPIYVAVYKTTNLPPQYWLGSPEFASLAASAALFDDTNNRTAPLSLGDGHNCGPTLSGAIAGIPVRCNRRTPFLTLVEPETHWHRATYAGQEYVVNYSTLRDLQETALDVPNASAVKSQGNKIAGMAVLLGDTAPHYTSDVRDHCNVPVPSSVPGVTGNSVPCIFVHAAGVYTLKQARLSRFTPQARIGVDLALAFVVLGAVSGLRLYYARRTFARVATERLQNAGFWLFAIALILTCTFLARATHLVWDDYVLVAVVLLLHTSIERRVIRLWAWVRSILPKVVFEEQVPR